jgi:hypothetical protein
VTAAPELWVLFMETFLGAEDGLAQALWPYMPQKDVLVWQFGLIKARADAQRPAQERVRRLGRVLTPRLLLGASLALAPEDGRPRPKGIIDLEERILSMMNRDGTWRW